jgi:hypothetical protein
VYIHDHFLPHPYERINMEYQRFLDSGPFCPHGFVVPDNLNGDGVFFINRTMSECAAACKFAMYTDKEWESFETLADVAAYLSIPLLLLVIYAYCFDVEKRSQYLVRVFACTSFVLSINNAVMQSLPLEQRFCRNNAESFDASDGLNLCTFQSVLQVYVSLAMALCWLLQAVRVYLKVVLERRSSLFSPKADLMIIFGMPLLAVVVFVATGSQGYSRGSFGCLFDKKVMDNKMDIIVILGPIAVICFVGMALMISVLWKMFSVFGAYYRSHLQRTVPEVSAVPTRRMQAVSSSGMSESTPTCDSSQPTLELNSAIAGAAPQQQLQELELRSMWDLMIYFRTPMLFLILFLFIYVTIVWAGFRGGSRRNIYLKSFRVWGQCALDNYNGVDSSWHEVCGAHPATRVPALGRQLFSFIFPGQGILIAIIYGPSVGPFLYRELQFLWHVVRVISTSTLDQESGTKKSAAVVPVVGAERPTDGVPFTPPPDFRPGLESVIELPESIQGSDQPHVYIPSSVTGPRIDKSSVMTGLGRTLDGHGSTL